MGGFLGGERGGGRSGLPTRRRTVRQDRTRRVIVSSPGRNFVTLKLTTDEGVTGVGDATLNGRELAVAELPARPRRARC